MCDQVFSSSLTKTRWGKKEIKEGGGKEMFPLECVDGEAGGGVLFIIAQLVPLLGQELENKMSIFSVNKV